MPSSDAAAAAASLDLLPRVRAGFATAVFGVLPALGFCAEFWLGVFSTVLPMFPTGWHAAALAMAVATNVVLHATVGSRRWLFVRAAGIGFVLGVALLYALVEAPGLGYMLFLAIIGLGILAAAPYFAALGCWRLVGDLVRTAARTERPAWQPLAVVFAVAALPLALEFGSWWAQHTTRIGLLHLAATMRSGDAEAAERAADEVRRGDLRLQREICGGERFLENGRWLADDELGRGRFAHIGDRRPFWFHGWPPRSEQRDIDDARIAFHRAHGRAWTDVRLDRDDRIVQTSSEVTVVPEAEAAIARVDHAVEVSTDAPGNFEARFDIRCPPGAVASSLSLWIEGTERPAAFASSAKVTAAYDAVKRRKLDPALLREIAPGRLQLLLFPVTRAASPMRVRVGFTVPMRIRGNDAWLHLPEVVFAGRRSAAGPFHRLLLGEAGSAEPVLVDDARLQKPLRFVRPSGKVVAQDADGFVVQDLAPRVAPTTRGPWIVVLETSASVAAVLPRRDALLDAFPPDDRVTLFVAHGDTFRRLEATAADPELRRTLQTAPCTGGVDARAALGAAITEAVARSARRVLWVHGAAPTLHHVAWPALPPDLEIVTFALHPRSNAAVESDLLRDHRRELDRAGGSAAVLVDSLAEHVRHGLELTFDQGDVVRHFVRADTAPDGVVKVSDQIARLHAAWRARDLAKAGAKDDATTLAARYRVVTAGAGAVVLENRAQYEQHGLDPGAPIGREPQEMVGAGPVPEPSTWALVAAGLLVIAWRRARDRG